MNLHMNAHFPLVPVCAAVLGVLMLAFVTKAPWSEVGRALLWGGVFAALLASN